MGCWCMAWWRRGLRGCGPDVGAGAGRDRERLSRAGSAVALEVPRPGHRCLWGAYSADIPENAPHRPGAGAGPPGTVRRMAQQSPQHQEHLVTRVRSQRPGAAVHAARGRRCAVRGARRGGGGAGAAVRGTGRPPGGGGARYGAAARGRRCVMRGGPIGGGGARYGAAARGRRCAVRGGPIGGGGAGGLSCAIRVTGPGPGGRGTAGSAPARAICLPRRLPFPG